MSWLINAFRNLAAWWREGLAVVGTTALLEHEWPMSSSPESALEADREAWDEERARLRVTVSIFGRAMTTNAPAPSGPPLIPPGPPPDPPPPAPVDEKPSEGAGE